MPTSTLPGVLKTFAEWNPTSSLANALRHLFGNPGGADPARRDLARCAHPFAYTLIWAVGDRRRLRAAVGGALPALDQDLRSRSTSRAARSPARTPPSM